MINKTMLLLMLSGVICTGEVMGMNKYQFYVAGNTSAPQQQKAVQQTQVIQDQNIDNVVQDILKYKARFPNSMTRELEDVGDQFIAGGGNQEGVTDVISILYEGADKAESPKDAADFLEYYLKAAQKLPQQQVSQLQFQSLDDAKQYVSHQKQQFKQNYAQLQQRRQQQKDNDDSKDPGLQFAKSMAKQKMNFAEKIDDRINAKTKHVPLDMNQVNFDSVRGAVDKFNQKADQYALGRKATLTHSTTIATNEFMKTQGGALVAGQILEDLENGDTKSKTYPGPNGVWFKLEIK